MVPAPIRETVSMSRPRATMSSAVRGLLEGGEGPSPSSAIANSGCRSAISQASPECAIAVVNSPECRHIVDLFALIDDATAISQSLAVGGCSADGHDESSRAATEWNEFGQEPNARYRSRMR